jgi:hypothetical protein
VLFQQEQSKQSEKRQCKPEVQESDVGSINLTQSLRLICSHTTNNKQELFPFVVVVHSTICLLLNSMFFVFLSQLTDPCSDYFFKILLIGDSGVGKSCLLLRFAVIRNHKPDTVFYYTHTFHLCAQQRYTSCPLYISHKHQKYCYIVETTRPHILHVLYTVSRMILGQKLTSAQSV